MICEPTGKVIHDTEGGAWAAIRSVTGGLNGKDFSPYRCPHGGQHWHVGHSGVKFGARIKRALGTGGQPLPQKRNRRGRRK